MRRMQRHLAFLLAIFMLLPLIVIPAVAENEAPAVLWAGDDFESETPTANIQSHPTSMQVIEEEEGNHAVRFEAVGVKGGANPADYYVVTQGKSANQTTFIEVTDATVNTDSTVNGTVLIGGTTYTFESQSVDKNETMTLNPALSGYTLYSGNQVDAFYGCGNVASPVRMKNPLLSPTDASSITFEASYYFGNGTKGTFASRARSTDNGYIELFGVKASGTTVAVQAHENANITKGAAAIVSTGKWIKITSILDTATGYITVYVNDVIAFTTFHKDNITLTTPVNVKANSWDLLQLNRNNRTADSIGGYVMIDDPVIYDGGNRSTEIVPSFTDNYENYSVGTQITTTWGYNTQKAGEIVAYNKVLADEDGNQFVRLPIVYDGNATVGTAGSTNQDKTLMINQPAFSASDEFMVLDISYRPHGNETTAAETIELQLREFTFDLLAENGATLKPQNGTAAPVTEDIIGKAGFYLNLFTINLNSGAITSPSHDETLTGAPGLVLDEWNDIRFILNLETPFALLYVNGELYMTIETMVVTGTNWDSCTNASNISVGGGKVIIAKANKIAESFKTIQEAAEDYSNVNYIDIDNVSVKSTKGEELLGDFDPTSYENIVTTEENTSIRHFAPHGLRFVSRVDLDALEEMHALIGTKLLSLEFGTLITLAENLENCDFTVEALKAKGLDYLTVAANYGSYFFYDNDESTTHIAGSIVRIKDEHLLTAFAGIGYVKLKLITGEEYYYYSETATTANVKATAQTVIDTTGLSGYSKAAKRAIEAYASSTSLSEIIAKDMKGLNVLALGDSLFAGTDEGTPGCDRASQWVNLLGNNHDWTLTNLGIGGMTVSYTDKNYAGAGHKASMYDWLFNDINDFRWGSSYNTEDRLYYPGTGWSYNYYYQCGDFTGKSAEDVDLIILEGGCNDYGTAIAAPLGTVDSKDPATFLGAWNCIVEKLLEQYPNAKIVFITTWYLGPQSRPDNLTSMEYSTSINTLYDEVYADNDRICLIDAGNPDVSGVDMLDSAWRSQYSNDAYHLKNSGMEIMANNMLPRLWEYWLNSSEEEIN